MSQKIPSAVLGLVLSALFVSSAYALPPVHPVAGLRTEGFLAAAWSWLASLVLPATPVHTSGVRVTWEKAGSQMDPNGLTNNFSPNANMDAGSQMDPNGNK
jgi:ABC-type dipeptide/oligopeptide/nickel transport system permease component